MTCHNCNDAEMVRFGIRHGVQRYRCKVCKRTKSDSPENPLGNLRVPVEKAIQVVSLLCESMGIRACERLTGLNRRTVLNILQAAGRRASLFLDAKIRDLNVEQVQVDELINFVYSRGQNTPTEETQRGDFATFLSVDRDSKLIINWRIGKRDRDEAMAFLNDLRKRVPIRFQLTTDGWHAYSGYVGAVREVFGASIDYATEIKRFGRERPAEGWRASPMKIMGVTRTRKINQPVMRMATTSHAERMNLSVRLFSRRYTRATLGFSKTLENLKYAVALFVWHFNFVRVHSAHGKTPAEAAGLQAVPMTISNLFNYQPWA